jgi:hypothetical protein
MVQRLTIPDWQNQKPEEPVFWIPAFAGMTSGKLRSKPECHLE